MGKSDKTKAITKEEWRLLGYYYDIDHENKKWIIIGSKFGIEQFVLQLKEYAASKKNEAISEHDHWGPYGYLKIMTWKHPDINKDCICGSLEDIRKLSQIIEKYLDNSQINQIFEIRGDYAKDCDYSIEFRIKEYGFDPAAEDTQLW